MSRTMASAFVVYCGFWVACAKGSSPTGDHDFSDWRQNVRTNVDAVWLGLFSL
ncbi:SDR family NA, partial [Sesbania bispinosa]